MYLARTKKACFSGPKRSFWVWQGFFGFSEQFWVYLHPMNIVMCTSFRARFDLIMFSASSYIFISN